MFSDIIVEHCGGGTSPAPSAAALTVSGNNVNVCWNEKTTQTEETARPAGVESGGNLLLSPNPSLVRKSSLKQQRSCSPRMMLPDHSQTAAATAAAAANNKSAAAAVAAVTGLTCQELLALSGALGAALPTPLALPSQYVSDELPPSSSGGAATAGTVPTSASGAKHNNNNQLAPPGMPILPSLAMALWPEPYTSGL